MCHIERNDYGEEALWENRSPSRDMLSIYTTIIENCFYTVHCKKIWYKTSLNLGGNRSTQNFTSFFWVKTKISNICFEVKFLPKYLLTTLKKLGQNKIYPIYKLQNQVETSINKNQHWANAIPCKCLGKDNITQNYFG